MAGGGIRCRKSLPNPNHSRIKFTKDEVKTRKVQFSPVLHREKTNSTPSPVSPSQTSVDRAFPPSPTPLQPHWPLWSIVGGGKQPGAAVGSLLGCRIVQLVFPGSAEAGLHSRVSPEPFDDSSQLSRHHSLLGAPSQHKQLPGIILQDRSTSLGVHPRRPSPPTATFNISAFIN